MHRRTWTIAAVALGAVFMVGGQLGTYLPAIAAGFIKPGGGADGWPQLAYQLGAAFGLGSVLVVLIATVVLALRGRTRGHGVEAAPETAPQAG